MKWSRGELKVRSEVKPGKPIRILLLEDDPLDAELCLRKLKSSDLEFTIHRVGDSEQFKLEAGSGKYDVVLGDYRLPNWSGLDAIRWLRASGSTLPFILVTGTLGDELASNPFVQEAMERA